MAKFSKKGAEASQEIPTAALPDIIFMLLFFFMVTTVLRDTTLIVKNKLPQATQLQKLKNKSLISYIYIGSPKEKWQSTYGKEPRIQVNDVIIEPKEIPLYVLERKNKLPEVLRDQITMSLKVDIEAKMGIVTDVKQELRKANARKVLYSSTKKVSL